MASGSPQLSRDYGLVAIMPLLLMATEQSPITYYTRKNFGILSSWYDGKGDVIHLMFPCSK